MDKNIKPTPAKKEWLKKNLIGMDLKRGERAARNGGYSLRVMGRGGFVTQDIRSDRINVEVDGCRVITKYLGIW